MGDGEEWRMADGERERETHRGGAEGAEEIGKK